MKRRDFLITSAGVTAGTVLSPLALGQTKPCPPSTLSVEGGTSATTACTPPGDLEADWQLRSGQDSSNPQPGVVWFHDFRSDAEVNAFRWSAGVGGGNDPNAQGNLASNLRRITTDGMASGACLEILRGPGSSEPSVWWRPFSPMTSPGNGKSKNDPGAAGSIPARTWNATQGGNALTEWNQGWYGHPSYANADPTHFEGTDFYLQVVCKMDPRRITGGNEANRVGKFIWFSTAEGASSLSNGEHVIWSYGHSGNQGDHNYLRVYSLGVTGIGAFDPLDDEDPSSRIQPGSSSAADWYYSGGWDTLLFHLRLGQLGVTSGSNATLLEIWAAHQGETTYTKVWNQEYGSGAFEKRNGLQALLLAAYNNGANFPQQFYHRYAQVIFSKQFIPFPQVYA